MKTSLSKKDIEAAIKAEAVASDIVEIMKSKHAETKSGEYPNLQNYIETNPFAADTIERLADKNSYNLQFNKERDIERLVSSINRKFRRDKLVTRWIITSAAAAVIACCALIFTFSGNREETVIAFTPEHSAILIPTLIKSDGQTIDLTKEELQSVSETVISTDSTSTLLANTIEFNTIIVPAKYTYNVVLEDGTEIMLNAHSELKYPVKFSGDKREVSLKGEGYFKVAKSAKPFIVNASGVNVRVYGTVFNINAYDTEEIRTVLVEGSVGVSLTGDSNSKELMMTPNQLVTANMKSGNINVEDVINPERSIAWTEGYFRVDSERLYNMLKELAVWYNVEFVFENAKDRDIIITAILEREGDLDETLKMIENVTDLKFTKKGGQYVIE